MESPLVATDQEQLVLDMMREALHYSPQRTTAVHVVDRTPLAAASVGDILSAHLRLLDEMGEVLDESPLRFRLPAREVRWLQVYAAAAIDGPATRREGVIELVDFVLADPRRFQRTHEVLARVKCWSSYATTLDAAGALTRAQYDACQFTVLLEGHQCTRTQYLRRQLRQSARLLSVEQSELAHVLAGNWDGTLESLRATARQLRP